MSVTENNGYEKTIFFTYTWRIENFTLCLLNKRQTIDSPVFRVEQFEKSEWKLMLYLPDVGERIKLNLCRCRDGLDDSSKISVDGRLFIATTDGSHVFLNKINYYFKPTNHKYEKPLTLSLAELLKDTNTYLLKDTLTVGFQFLTNSMVPLSENVVECIARTKLSLMKYTSFLPLKFPEERSNYKYTITERTASTSAEHPRLKVDLHCYDGCKKNKDALAISVFINNSDALGFVHSKISFLNKEIIKYAMEWRRTINMEDQSWLIPISQDTFNNYSISGANCLKLEFVVSNGKFISLLEETIYKQEIPDTKLGDSLNVSYLQTNLMEMFAKKILCDFKVIVSGREFPVHKTILAAASPVFRAIFESGMAETAKSQVIIEEFSVEIVEKMLEFSYSNSAKDLKWDTTLELYSIADKYQIHELKSICSSFLESTVSVETVPDLLVLVDLHKDNHLSKVAENFIFNNSNAVFQSSVWNQFVNNDPRVASKAMYQVCKMYSGINSEE